MEHLKKAVIGGGVALVLSLLSGILGRVTFFTLLFRGIISGVLFGALIFGALILLNRFMPELFYAAELPDEKDGLVEKGDQSQNDDLRGASVDITVGDDDQTGSLTEETKETEETAGMGNDFMAELDDELPGKVEKYVPERFASEESSEVENIEEFEDVEALPDVTELSDTFMTDRDSQEADPGIDSINSNSRTGGSDTVEINGGQEDPAMVAKALRTWMNKGQDQKG